MKRGIWENSWVRFPRRLLNPYTEELFLRDLLADKKHHGSGMRSDVNKFIFNRTESRSAFLSVIC